ncbi:MAG: hypothetical protein ACRDQY_01255 [Pseudonocardiaceae bacterium]
MATLITGGDPMVMSTQRLRHHLEPPMNVDTVRTIRIGTKSVAYWPHRFVTDPDADDTLRLFEQVVESGRDLPRVFRTVGLCASTLLPASLSTL